MSSLDTLRLSEWRRTEPVELDPDLAGRLAEDRRLGIEVTPLGGRRYRLQPQSRVGTVVVGDLQVIVRPAKLSMARVLWMLGYGDEIDGTSGDSVGLLREDDPADVVARSFSHLVDRALARGVLQGYRTVEEAVTGFRGRLRIEDQVRKRFARFPPAEVRYDEFTEDIEENRLLRAALETLLALPLDDARLRGRLRRNRGALAAARSVRYPSADVPKPVATRLNARYQPALGLARVILENAAFELDEGHVESASFVLDMNTVFERFVHRTLLSALDLPPGMALTPQREIDLAASTVPAGAEARVGGLRRRLDSALVGADGRVRAIVETKYKDLDGVAGRDDVHQLLAYCVATGLPGGILVYVAHGKGAGVHTIKRLGTEIHVMSVDLAQSRSRAVADMTRIARAAEQLAACANLFSLRPDALETPKRPPRRGATGASCRTVTRG